jgi:hypothetical protein
MFATTGLRRSEVLNLKIEDVDLEKRMVMPKAHRGRSKRVWVSFFNEECAEALKRYLSARNDKNPKLFPLGRGKEMRLKRILSYLMLVLVTWFGFAWVMSLAFAEATEYKETMYVTVFFVANPGELDLVNNVHLISENSTVGPLVNTSLEAFNKGFVELECALAPEVNSFFLSFNVFFELSVENETAVSYAEDIIQEFLKVFNYQELGLLWRNQGIQESKMWVHRSFGYKPYSKEEVSAFLEHKPTDGFGRFIDGLISKYVPGDATTKLSASYSLKRVGSDFYWTLKVTATTSELLPWDVQGYSESINLNEILNNNKPLIEIPLDNQEIIVLIQRERTFQLSRGLITYSIDIERIQPKGYTVADSKFENWPNTTEIKYETLFPIENIVIDITVNSSTQKQEFPSTLFEGVVVAVVVFLVLFFCLKKKLKRR